MDPSTGFAGLASIRPPALPRCSALLNTDAGASNRPMRRRTSARRYRHNTLILETSFETSDGAVKVIDFMPPRGRNSDVVRIVCGERGRVRMHTELVLRFDYGRSIPWVNHLRDGTFRAIAGPDMVLLHTPVALHGRDLTTVGDFDVEAGTRIPFVLTHGHSHLSPPLRSIPNHRSRAPRSFGQNGRHEVNRAANGRML